MRQIALITFCTGLLCLPVTAAAQSLEAFPDAPIRNPFLPQLPEKPEAVETNGPGTTQPQTTTQKQPDQPQTTPRTTPNQTDGGTDAPKPPPIPKPNFRITGIIWNSPRPQAIINGQVLDIGDVIDGYRIDAIRPAGIEVSIRGVTMTVEP